MRAWTWICRVPCCVLCCVRRCHGTFQATHVRRSMLLGCLPGCAGGRGCYDQVERSARHSTRRGGAAAATCFAAVGQLLRRSTCGACQMHGVHMDSLHASFCVIYMGGVTPHGGSSGSCRGHGCCGQEGRQWWRGPGGAMHEPPTAPAGAD